MTMLSSAGLRLLAVILALILIAYAVIVILPAGDKYKVDNPLIADGGTPMLVAHRGGGAEFPQNTLEAFYNAYSVDKNVIMETDVNITKDGVLILLHNERLDATTNVTGYAYDWNYSDLIAQRVDFGYNNPTEHQVISGELRYFTVDGERKAPTDVSYPEGVKARDSEIFLATTLENLIVAFPDNVLSVEIKQSGETGQRALREAVRLLAKHDAFDRVILTSAHSGIYRELKRLDREGEVPESFMYSPGAVGMVAYYALNKIGLDALYTDGIAVLQVPVDWYGISFAYEKLIEKAHEHNIAVQYWTVNDEEEMRYLIKLGADAIMTDKPSLLKRVLDEYG